MTQKKIAGNVRRMGLMATLGLIGLCVGAPIAAQAVRTGDPSAGASNVDLFAGYSYFYPYHADINYYYYKPIQPGAVGSATVYLNRWFGVQAEGGFHPEDSATCAVTAEGGVAFRKIVGHFSPTAHVLAGGVRFDGPVTNPCTWGYGGTAGVGMDYVLHSFHERLAIRLFQADVQYNHVDYGRAVPLPGGGYTGGELKMVALRGSAGLVFRFGQATEEQPVQMSCMASPSTIYPGDPLQITASTLNIDIRKPADYTWQTSAGSTVGKGESVTMNTAGLAPGEYTVNGSVQQGRHASGRATCSTSFTVKAYEPPTVSCVASPANIHVNESATITANGVSPQNRPLTYRFTSSAGQISAQGNSATLGTGGVPPGNVSVTCVVTDDLGKSATSMASVNITMPPPPPVPVAYNLCTVAFDNDLRRPARVDNEAKGCLDDIALAIQRQSDASLVLLGERADGEGEMLAAQRAVNVKKYLTIEKGIDASRIEVRTAPTRGRTVESILVPNGATLPADNTEMVNERMVIPSGQAYGTMPGPAAHTYSRVPRRKTQRKRRKKTTVYNGRTAGNGR